MRTLRTACVLVPQLAVQVALQRRSDLAGQPVIVGGYPHERRTVAGASPQALAAGVSPGMPLRQAAALCPEATFLPSDSSRTGEVFAALLHGLGRFSPALQPEPPGTVYLDITGVALPARSAAGPADEEGLLQTLLREVRDRTGLQAAAGAGSGTFVARVAAVRAGTGAAGAIPPGEERAALAPAPVTLLPCSPEMQRRLHRFGLRTLGDLAALPFGPVQAQFGAEGARMWRLATGIDTARFIPQPSSEVLQERLELPSPTADREVLSHAAGRMLQRIFSRPEVGNRLARRLAIGIALENGSAWEQTITFRDATADVRRALFVVRTRLEALDLPAAAVAMTITLHNLCGERGRQEDLFSFSEGKGRRMAQLEEALHQLRVRFGTPAVLRVVEVEPWSRIPERRTALTEYVLSPPAAYLAGGRRHCRSAAGDTGAGQSIPEHER